MRRATTMDTKQPATQRRHTSPRIATHRDLEQEIQAGKGPEPHRAVHAGSFILSTCGGASRVAWARPSSGARKQALSCSGKRTCIKDWLLKDEGPIGRQRRRFCSRHLLRFPDAELRPRQTSSARAKPRQVACPSPCRQRSDGMDDDAPSSSQPPRAQACSKGGIAWLLLLWQS